MTDTARKVTREMAQEESKRRGNGYVGPEHILAAVLSVHDDLLTALFSGKAEAIGDHLNELMAWGGASTGTSMSELPCTPRVEAALRAARREADSLGHTEVGLGHVVLGLMADPLSIPGHVLKTHGLRMDVVRGAVSRAYRQAGDR